MRVQPVGSATAVYQSEPSEVVQRLQSITQIIGRARAQGAEEVQMVLRNDNPVDSEVVTRLSRLYNLEVDYNRGPSVKLTVRFE